MAQRQYLKIGGVISDYGTGANFNSVFTHEMGHCFFHDDIYDPIKYPDGAGLVSVMNGASEISISTGSFSACCGRPRKTE